MRFGLQIPNFTTDETPGALFDGVVGMATRGGGDRLRLGVGDGPLLPTAADGRPQPADARRLHAARRAGGPDVAGQAGRHGDRRHLPQPGAPGQDRHHARRHQRRPGHPRHRGGVVRRGARRAGLRLPARRRAPRPPGGGAADLPGHVHRGGAELRRPLLPDPRGAQRAAARCSRAARRSWSAAAGRSGRCSWWRATPT